MDAPTAVISRPLSQQRPTQAYYVPRKLLESGRGAVGQSTDNGRDTDDARKVAIKLLSSDRSQSPKEKKENLRPKKNGQRSPKARREPRPLMSEIVTKPEYLKDKRSQKTKNLSSSSQKDIPVLLTEKLKELTTSVPRIISPKNCSGSLLSNAFSTRKTTERDICICFRPLTHVICRSCGFETTGRIFLDAHCHLHPMSPSHLFSDDLQACPNTICRSVEIFELPISNHTGDG